MGNVPALARSGGALALALLAAAGPGRRVAALEAPAWVARLRAANCGQAAGRVSEMYEDLPYPLRDPADEAPGQPFAVDPASTPAALAHRLFGGSVAAIAGAPGRPFRILVTGAGTGDATVMAAVSFHAAGLPLEIVHLDLSAASIDVARRRLAVHNLSGEVSVTFRHGSFLGVRPGDLGGPFDFVNAVGVVHHLPSPPEGLRGLRGLLRPGGGMFLMVYGALGRTGVYDVQDMWRLSGLSRRQFLAGPLQELLRQLPETSRLARNPRMMSQKVRQGDLTTVSDLLAHPCDHAYTVASLLELLAEADLHPVAFADPAKYSLPTASRTALAPLLADMEDEWQRAHFTELLRGDIFTHSLWAAPAPVPEVAFTADAVLCPSWRFVGYRLRLAEGDRERLLRQGGEPGAASSVPSSCSLYLDGEAYEGLPCLSTPLLEGLDCDRSAGELAEALGAEVRQVRQTVRLSSSGSLGLVAALYRAVSAAAGPQRLSLLSSPLRFRRAPWREKRLGRIVVKRDWDAVVEETAVETNDQGNALKAASGATAQDSVFITDDNEKREL